MSVQWRGHSLKGPEMGLACKPREAMMIPDFKPYELCTLNDDELDALFAYMRKKLLATKPDSADRAKALDLLDAIRFEFKRRIAKRFGWINPAP